MYLGSLDFIPTLMVKVTAYNDHKPLAAVLKKPVEYNLVGLQRMLCRIMGYDVEFKYVKGKDLFITDALSRSQTTNQHRSKTEQEIETTRLVHEEQIRRNCTSHCKERCLAVRHRPHINGLETKQTKRSC